MVEFSKTNLEKVGFWLFRLSFGPAWGVWIHSVRILGLWFRGSVRGCKGSANGGGGRRCDVAGSRGLRGVDY
jgi:hypothetical protein